MSWDQFMEVVPQCYKPWITPLFSLVNGFMSISCSNSESWEACGPPHSLSSPLNTIHGFSVYCSFYICPCYLPLGRQNMSFPLFSSLWTWSIHKTPTTSSYFSCIPHKKKVSKDHLWTTLVPVPIIPVKISESLEIYQGKKDTSSWGWKLERPYIPQVSIIRRPNGALNVQDRHRETGLNWVARVLADAVVVLGLTAIRRA